MPRRIAKNGEHWEQVSLFQWAALCYGQYPELRFMYAVPNAAQRNYGTAMWMKAEGLKAGVPDICLPAPRGIYHGLYVEMKYGNNKPTDEQNAYISFLESQVYCVRVCYSFEAARVIVKDYLDGKL